MTIGAWKLVDKYYLSPIGGVLFIVSVMLNWTWLYFVSLIIIIIGIALAYREKK